MENDMLKAARLESAYELGLALRKQAVLTSPIAGAIGAGEDRRIGGAALGGLAGAATGSVSYPLGLMLAIAGKMHPLAMLGGAALAEGIPALSAYYAGKSLRPTAPAAAEAVKASAFDLGQAIGKHASRAQATGRIVEAIQGLLGRFGSGVASAAQQVGTKARAGARALAAPKQPAESPALRAMREAKEQRMAARAAGAPGFRRKPPTGE
jgi:hypothetical protein